MPYEAVRGAKAKGGLVIGIFPGLSLDEHRGKYRSPVDGFDVLIYTGSGLMGREITNIRSCDMVVIAGGRTGTLGELAIAYDEGRLIGVLKGTGGITESVDPIIKIPGQSVRVEAHDALRDRVIHTAGPTGAGPKGRGRPAQLWSPGRAQSPGEAGRERGEPFARECRIFEVYNPHQAKPVLEVNPGDLHRSAMPDLGV